MTKTYRKTKKKRKKRKKKEEAPLVTIMAPVSCMHCSQFILELSIL